MFVSTVEEMRAMDKAAVSKYGIPDLLLMENAGHACVAAIEKSFTEARRFIIACGLGNNGGDGMVIARQLWSRSLEVKVLLYGDPDRFTGSAATNYAAAKACGVPILIDPSLEQLQQRLGWTEVIVDALLGTGLDRDVGGRLLEAIDQINRSGKSVVAVDIPSGIDGNTGQIRGVAVRADHCVSFGLPKRGNLLYPGAEYGGQLWVSGISFPPQLRQQEGPELSVGIPPVLPPRREQGHKRSFGDALFVAGAAGYFGAPALAAAAFLRAGGGYGRLATPAALAPVIAARVPELVFHPQHSTKSGALGMEALEELMALAERADFVVYGPGISLDPETQELSRSFCEGLERPLLIDGDGLSAIAGREELLSGRLEETILTPHVGEMARLLELEVGKVMTDPVGAVLLCARRYGAYVVLKGPHSLIASPAGRVHINLSGNSGMATAGSGDVLTGVIAAMRGLGLDVADAVAAGTFIHGLAGDLVSQTIGADGLIASDLVDALPEAVQHYREEHGAYCESYYGQIRVLD